MLCPSPGRLPRAPPSSRQRRRRREKSLTRSLAKGWYVQVGFVAASSCRYTTRRDVRGAFERSVVAGWRESEGMTQLLAVAIAAFFLGLGMAGEPLAPLHALLARS